MAKLKLTFPTLRHPPAVTCGVGALREVANATVGGRRVLFMTSASPAVTEVIQAAFEKAGQEASGPARVCKPAGEPTWDAVGEGARAIQEHRPELIVAVGGGSVLDWARLAWAQAAGLLRAEDSGALTLEADPSAPAFWLVPSTCGTGAEAGDVAVYTCSQGTKRAVISPAFLAERVILDARFLEHLQSENGLLEGLVCDALSHGLEASLSLVPNTLAKIYAAAAVLRILNNLPSDGVLGSSQRERLMEAGFLGGVAAANCSVGIVHAFAHSVGVDGIGHGLANAAALPMGLSFNSETHQMAGLLRELGTRDFHDLLGQVRIVSGKALEQSQASRLRALLGDSAYRAQVAKRMANDVALRSNPRRPKADDLRQFVDCVAEDVLT
jgi:alcohol dehydrogenase class IV